MREREGGVGGAGVIDVPDGDKLRLNTDTSDRSRSKVGRFPTKTKPSPRKEKVGAASPQFWIFLITDGSDGPGTNFKTRSEVHVHCKCCVSHRRA